MTNSAAPMRQPAAAPAPAPQRYATSQQQQQQAAYQVQAPGAYAPRQ